MHWFEKEANQTVEEKNWLERLNSVSAYVEENLTGKVDYEAAAQIACLSGYHFQRVFSFVAEIPFGEYVRRRRMTLAAFDLQSTKMKVIDIALKYGYESPEAFTRAFQSIHGVTPTMARGLGAKLKAYPKITFQVTIKGDAEMDYRIEQCGMFVLRGVEREFDLADESAFREVPEFWSELCASGQLDEIAVAGGYREGRPYGVRACSYSPEAGTRFRYLVGVVDEGQESLAGYTKMEVKAATWAVFTSETCTMQELGAAMQKVLRRIFTEWLPTSKYKAGNYQQELYYMAENGNMYCEIWKMIEETEQ